MASKRLKKKKQAAAVLQKQQPVQEKEPVTMEMEQNAQEKIHLFDAQTEERI